MPDYPSIKNALKEKFLELVENEVKKDPLLSQIQRHPIHEGDKLTSSSIDGYSETVKYKELSSKFGIKHDEIIEKGPEAIFSKVPEIAKDMIKQQSQQIFKKMGDATQKTGNILDAKSKPLSPELVLEALKKISIDFDESGNPIYPTLIVPPNQFEKIKNWEIDPEFRKKQKEIIEQKRKEWIDRENRRKLVD